MPTDPLSLMMVVLIGVLIIFMRRNNKKRQAYLRELQTNLLPGTEVMLNFGVYGIIRSVDHEENRLLLETSPGVILTVVPSTVSTIITPLPASDAVDDADAPHGASSDQQPAVAPDDDADFNERAEQILSQMRENNTSSDSDSAEPDTTSDDKTK